MRSLMKFSKTVRRGSIAGVSVYSCEMASIVFRPLPVMQATVVSLGLMASLPLDTWIRLVVWLILGMVIYFGYSRHHSKVQKMVRDEVKVAGD